MAEATEAQIRERDLYLLTELVAADVAEETDDSAAVELESALTEDEHGAFEIMLLDLKTTYAVLTPKRRAFAEQVCKRLEINTTPPAQRKPVPRGAEVELAEVLRVLPKRPPQARRPQ